MGTSVSTQQCLDAGVYRCPVDACGRWCAIVGQNSQMHTHLGQGDAAHRAACKEEDGGRVGWLRSLRQQAAPGSPAHYFNTVHFKDNARADALEAGRARFKAQTQRARAEAAEQACARQQAEKEPPARSAADDSARAMGLAPRNLSKEISAPGAEYDMRWLDGLDAGLLAELDAVLPRECDQQHRTEYCNMLHYGLQYALRNSGAAEARGFKFNVLAKAVTVGWLASGRRRPSLEGEQLADYDRMVTGGYSTEAALNFVRARACNFEEPFAEGTCAAPESFDPAKVLRNVLRLTNAGYLSKAMAQFSRSPVSDVKRPEVKACLRGLHPQRGDAGADAAPTAAEMADEPGAPSFVTLEEAFKEIFQVVPKARAMSVDATSYEELGRLYWMGQEYRTTLLGLVRRINAGGLSAESVELMGNLVLVGISKPDGGTRPIGIPSALRRLAGRVLIHQLSRELGEFFTTTKVPPELLQAAGHAHDTPCHIPLQLGVGVRGGAEIAIASARTHLSVNPGHAIASDDKKNGFNAISRRAIFAGLRRWFPALIPTVRQWYSRRAVLFWRGEGGGFEQASDEWGDAFYSEEGCAQGDPLGPFLWSIGYHWSLLRIQAQHPSTLLMAYLDDTYYLNSPPEALAAMATGAVVTKEETNVASNYGKQEVFSPRGGDGALDAAPATLRGSPHAPPQPEKGYAGGLLACIKVLGSFIGDDEACSARLVQRVQQHMGDLPRVGELRDTPKCTTSMQVQLSMNRFCGNTRLTYFLRSMPPSVTLAAARLHDECIARVFHEVVVTAAATESERLAALEQARLPVKMGGLGLTSMEKIRGAAWVGGWALVWRPLQQLHAPFKAVDISDAHTSVAAFQELQSAHGGLLATHARVAAQWAEYDRAIWDYTRDGAAHYRFHPTGLCERDQLLPVARFGSDSELHVGAQRRYSTIIHHESWRLHWNLCAGTSRREAVRFIAVSQPYAGAFLNAIPMRQPFRMPSWALRLQVQRRLGLPITAGLDGARSRHGKAFDAYGDVAQNDGLQGHAHRHSEVLTALVGICRSVWGTRVEMEPQDYTPYSTHRPDAVAYMMARNGKSLVLDTKIGDPLTSEPVGCERRGAYVGMGNVEPGFYKVVSGLKERGDESHGRFESTTGRGHVAAVDGDYAQTIKLGHEVCALIFESFGGFNVDVVRLLKRLASDVGHKLSSRQYDETTWAARSWLSFQTQKLSVALHMALAFEIGAELGLGVCLGGDPRAADAGGGRAAA